MYMIWFYCYSDGLDGLDDSIGLDGLGGFELGFT